MRKPSKPKYQRVDALFQAILAEVNGAFPSNLSLAGPTPEIWPDDETPERHILINRIKAGIAFYFTEDFLLSSKEEPQGVWAGSYWRGNTRYLYKLGDCGLPSFAEFMGIHPKRRFLQPVALRSFEDAKIYHRAGLVYDRYAFADATARWLLRNPSEADAPDKELRNRIFQRGHLYYLGDYVSRTVECLFAEINFVLGVGPYEPHLPPTQAFEFSFHRQLQLLVKAWEAEEPQKDEVPALEWVREKLSHPVIEAQPVNDGFALPYRRELMSILKPK